MRPVVALALLAACSGDTSPMPDARLFPPVSIPDARALPDAPPASSADALMPVADAGGGGGGADAPENGPRYTSDRTYSPITAAVAHNLRNIALMNGDVLKDDVFEKVGDSITVAVQFLTCFAGANVDLGDHADLQPVVDTFKAKDAAGGTSYERVSVAAHVGWSADAVLAGDPSLLQQEGAAVKPRYAVVMFGTNDVEARDIYTYTASMWNIVDGLAAGGIVPVMSSIPPRDDSVTANANVPRFNAVSRGLAQAHLYPYMDFWKELEPLAAHGLGSDGVHPNVYSGGACKLTADGLKYGYNVRNLLTMTSLARAQSAVTGDAPPDPEPAVPAVQGLGTYDKPFGVNGFPFTDIRDTRQATNTISTYTGCNATQDESGGEYVYKLVLSSPTTVRATVMMHDKATTDVDIHLMKGLTAADCLVRNDKDLSKALQPGTYYIILDTYRAPTDSAPRAGEYFFLLTGE
jgi:hypothetical protein